MKILKAKALAIMITVLFAAGMRLRADDDTASSLRLEYWNYGVAGNATVKGSSADLEDTSKVINGSNHGAILGGEWRFDRLGLMMDLVAANQSISQQISSSESADWDMSTTMLTGAGAYSFVDHEFEGGECNLRLDGIAGIRGYVNYYEIKFNPYNPANDRDRSEQSNWVDPMLGLKFKANLNSKWALELYGDAGGFAVGAASKLSVLTYASVVWSLTPEFCVTGGYRIFDLQSADQSGTRPTELDIQMRGFTLGIEGRF